MASFKFQAHRKPRIPHQRFHKSRLKSKFKIRAEQRYLVDIVDTVLDPELFRVEHSTPSHAFMKSGRVPAETILPNPERTAGFPSYVRFFHVNLQ